ncbi:MAG: transporter substrate-binding domain-containing protein [Lachnospiraceae bacterium]|nr:transporter substrate-binding domain-containing protein [Lachnospiraceae bacterium]
MRKLFVSAAAAVLSFALLTGCGSSVAPNTVNSVDDLKGKIVGVQLGTTGDIYISDYEKDGSGTTVERYNKGADAVQALKQGRIDAVIIDEQPALKFVEKNDDLKVLDEAFSDEQYAICIAKGSDLTAQFNSAISELKADGTLQSIIDNYIGDDTVGKSPYTTPEGTQYSKGMLKMATNAAFEPYEYYEGEEIKGIDVDLAKAICDRLGYELQVEDMEFDAIITAVSSGKSDFGAAGMTVTEDRLKNIDFTDTYTTTKQMIIVRKN